MRMVLPWRTLSLSLLWACTAAAVFVLARPTARHSPVGGLDRHKVDDQPMATVPASAAATTAELDATVAAVLRDFPDGRVPAREFFDQGPALAFDADFMRRMAECDKLYDNRGSREDHTRGYAIMSDLANGLSREDLPAAMAWARQAWENGEMGGGPYRNMVNRWGYLDPEGALAFAMNEPEDQRDDAVDNAFGGWMRKDPEAALTYIEQNGYEYGGRDIEDDLHSWLGELAASDGLPPALVERITAQETPLAAAVRHAQFERLVESGQWQQALDNRGPAGEHSDIDYPAYRIINEWGAADAQGCLAYVKDQHDPALWKTLLQTDQFSTIAASLIETETDPNLRLVLNMAYLGQFSDEQVNAMRPLMSAEFREFVDITDALDSGTTPTITNPLLQRLYDAQKAYEQDDENPDPMQVLAEIIVGGGQ